MAGRAHAAASAEPTTASPEQYRGLIHGVSRQQERVRQILHQPVTMERCLTLCQTGTSQSDKDSVHLNPNTQVISYVLYPLMYNV